MAPFTRTGTSVLSRLPIAIAAGVFAMAVAALAVGGVAGAASAAPAPTGAELAARTPAAASTTTITTGWLRLAHLSPDTSAVDIRLSALAGGTVTQSLSDIGYGAVSPYMALTPGTYVVSMVPTGGDFAFPVITASVTVVAGEPLTVAAFGKNASLQAAVYRDDLTTPSAGQSRVRVVQASTIVPSVSIATSAGMTIGTNIAEGTATDYASIPGGAFTLDLTGGTVHSTADVDLAAGSISTLFVLDNASGGLALKSVLDSSSAGDLPVGGVQTGGGGTAVTHTDVAVPSARRFIDIGTGVLCLVAVAVGVFVHRRRTRSSLDHIVDQRMAHRLTQDGAEPSTDELRYEPQVRRRLPESYQRHDRQWYDDLAQELQERERQVRGDKAA